ncbi:PREDICTED: uncharacterized protein LOC109170903 [Ipomoea nil]|uniref:uncharacterized protein LOC109170903 n=1 Tax=Ipomoea nil TaxID=35883 RepID=UPI000901FD56|nr:PREDICTED: uncharacterized protein LOC109170903 [Ipomoea nil]
MNVTAMRDHRDLKTLSTDKLFSDLKAYEFEMKSRTEEEREEKNNALVAEQPSTSRKFKRFMRKNNHKSFPKASTSRRHKKETLEDNSNLYYNCRKPRHFMAECLYPKVSKNQSVQEETKVKDRRFNKKDKRKALISDPLETSESEESSGNESDSSTDDNALFGMSMSSNSNSQDLCLMAHETDDDEVTSKSFDSGNSNLNCSGTVTDVEDDIREEVRECVGVGVGTNSEDQRMDQTANPNPPTSHEPSTSQGSFQPDLKWLKNHPQDQIIGDVHDGVRTRSALQETQFSCFLSQVEPKDIDDALKDPSWIEAMQEELNQFERNDVWELVSRPSNHNVIGTKWVFRNKANEDGIVVRNTARLVAKGYSQEEGIDFDETFASVARLKQ